MSLLKDEFPEKLNVPLRFEGERLSRLPKDSQENSQTLALAWMSGASAPPETFQFLTIQTRSS